jgi:hypothetical protein
MLYSVTIGVRQEIVSAKQEDQTGGIEIKEEKRGRPLETSGSLVGNHSCAH